MIRFMLIFASLLFVSFVSYAAGCIAERTHELASFSTPVSSQTIAPGGPYRGNADETWQPPPAMTKDTFVAVRFGDRVDVHANCGQTAQACETQDGVRVPLLELPNPCAWTAESYALVVCHEIGHAEGWAGDHRGGHFVDEWIAHSEVFQLRSAQDADQTGEWAISVSAPSEVEAEAHARSIFKSQKFSKDWRIVSVDSYN